MAKTNIEILLSPRGGLNTSLPGDLISSLEMTNCANVFFQDGLVKKRYGYTLMGNNLPLPGSVVGIDQYYLFDGNSYLITVTTKGVFYWLETPDLWECLNEKEVEDDCETTWSDPGDNVTVAGDTSDYKVDSTSQKITLATGFTTGLAAYRDQSLGDKSGYGIVRLWIKSSVDTEAGDLQFLIDDSAGCGSPKETIDIPALVADTWKIVILEADDPASNMNSIESLGINVAVDNGAQIIRIDDIQFVKTFSSDVQDSDLASFDYVRKLSETDPWWIMSNGVDVIKKWDGDTTGSILDLITAPAAGYTAKIVIEFKSHLLLMDITGSDSNRYPQRILWSDTADPEDFEGGNSSYTDLTGSDWIVGAYKFKGDYLVVFKERSIWVGYATGDSAIFQFDAKVTGAGCAAGKTIETLGDELIFLGWDDVYVFNGIDYEPIGTKIQRELFRTLNPEQMGRSFGVVIEEQKEYWLFVASTVSTYPDIAWCFNYDLNKWTKHTFSDYLTMYGYYYLEASLTWDDMAGAWEQSTAKWGDRTILKNAPTTLFGDVDGFVYQYDGVVNNDNGVAINGFFDTKDYNFTQLTSKQRILRLDTFYTGQGLKVYYSTDKGVSWTLIGTLDDSTNIETPRRLFLRLECNMVRFRFQNDTEGEHFEYNRSNLYWQPAGSRLLGG